MRQTLDSLDTLESDGRISALLAAVAGHTPDGAVTLARLNRTVLFGGTLPPAVKLAMGRRIAELCGAAYTKAHLERLAPLLPPASRERVTLAVGYADALTKDIHGVSDSDFGRLKGSFNDAQMVELTMVTCYFNYVCRLALGLGVAPEPWLKTTRPRLPIPAENGLTVARVALASDDELKMSVAVQERFTKPGPGNSLGVGIPNSVRAMVRVPDLYEAWMGKQPAKPGVVPRSTLLQVSLAVSKVNGCRYCVLHQVVGLRKQGVEISKLLAMEKDDSALTPEERAAVLYARKLTKTPGAISTSDWEGLQRAFPGSAAYEVLHQTCRFAFMNRFTDGLRLPSEDEAIHIYLETYGKKFQERPYKP